MMLKETIQRTNAAKEELREATAEVEMLASKCKNIERSLPQLSADVSAALASKKKAMDLFVREKNSQKNVDAAAAEYTVAQNQELQGQEMLEATRSAKTQAEQELPKLRITLDNAEKAVWQVLYEQIHSEILRVVDDRMPHAYAVFQKATGGAEYGNFLRGFFGNSPTFADVASHQEKIAKQHGIDI